MNCDEFRAQYLAGENGEGTAGHLAHCAACRSRQPDIEAGRNALKDPATWEEPPPELQDQVIALVAGNRNSAAPRPERAERWVRLVAAAAATVIAVGLYGLFRTPSPDWEVAMPGTQLAPLAQSTITGWNTDSGTRMVMTVEGLDPAPAGYVYEFWLSQGPLHISAGTFSAGGEIDLWTGVTRAEFPRLWVTLEPIDDDESPSGHTVLDTEA
jgi:hypothetical protein